MRVRSTPPVVVGSLLSAVFLILIVYIWIGAPARSEQGNRSIVSVPTASHPQAVPTTWVSIVASITPVSDPREAETIPSYPNAEALAKVPSGYLNQPDEVSFRSNDSVEVISAFYKSVFSKIGWMENECWIDELTGDICLNFVWPDVSESIPYKLQSNLLILNTCPKARSGDDDQSDDSHETRCVKIEILRTPYASRVPIFAEAQAIQTTDVPHETWQGFVTRRTTYVTDATVQEMRAFYSATLPKFGWVLDEAGGETEKAAEPTLRFRDRTTPLQELQPSVTISIEQSKAGRTEVTLVAEGPELSASDSR